MARKLLDIPLGELLEKFGAGSHKPGSGSAAALSAMISAKMIITVIDLTKDKPAYAKYVPDLLKISELIENGYFPELVELFQKDSDEFDRVIKLRRRRDGAEDPASRKAIMGALERAMRTATEIPMRIAELSLDLGDFAIEVFDHGFKAVRGDSGVGLNSAMCAISGCLYIIDLNLASLSPGDWMEEIAWRKNLVAKKYRELLQKDADRHHVLEVEVDKHIVDEFEKAMAAFRKGNLAQEIHSEEDLETLVRDLQNQVWIHRERIWTEGMPEGHVLSLRPDLILQKVMGYKYVEMEELGRHEANGEQFDVAGMIDKSKLLVQVSKAFSADSMRFTTAHELGHAILHEQTVLHRDRVIDRSKRTVRPAEEEMADKFASFFLMPGKLVRDAFEMIFERSRFELNEGNALSLRVGDFQRFREQCGNLRGLSRYLAGADYFAGKTVVPLATVFSVSIETMAIRLEELDLVRF